MRSLPKKHKLSSLLAACSRLDHKLKNVFFVRCVIARDHVSPWSPIDEFWNVVIYKPTMDREDAGSALQQQLLFCMFFLNLRICSNVDFSTAESEEFQFVGRWRSPKSGTQPVIQTAAGAAFPGRLHQQPT